VETLIAHGANVNAKVAEELGRTPLMEAVSNIGSQNMKPVVQALLAHGADVNLQDKDGLTPLMFVMDLSLANLLLTKSPDLTLQDNHGRTALLWAIYHDIPPLVAALLAHAANANDADKDGETALMLAASEKEGLQIIPMQLAKGILVDGRDPDDRTALMVAAGEGLPVNIRALLDAGANVNAHDKGGWTALFQAAHMNADTPTLKTLIQAGADVNTQDTDGETALKSALANETGDERVADLLLQHGANPNLADKDGDTPMIQAIGANHAPAFLSHLVAHGAKVNSQNKTGQTALMIGAGLQDTDSMARLLALGAGINIKDKAGATALFYAVTDKYSFPVEVAGEPAHHQLPDPKTQSFNEMMLISLRILLKHKASVNVRDKHGKTVLFYAIFEKHAELATVLKQAGAKE